MATAIETQLIRDPRTDDVAKWFADHRAIFTTRDLADDTQWELQTLYWGKPGTGMYSIRYVIMGPVLMVWGDLECAVYRWSSEISWEFLAGCDLQYFAGKCDASPKGRDYEDYDPRLALEDLNEALKERDGEAYKRPSQTLVDEARNVVRYGEEDWREWIRTNGYDLFGDCWYEYVGDFGKRTAQTCLAHLLGIKMAVAQLTKREPPR